MPPASLFCMKHSSKIVWFVLDCWPEVLLYPKPPVSKEACNETHRHHPLCRLRICGNRLGHIPRGGARGAAAREICSHRSASLSGGKKLFVAAQRLEFVATETAVDSERQ